MKVLIQRADGGVSVMQLIGEADAAAEVEKWAEVHGAPTDWQLVPDDVPLPDRSFRAAWRFGGRGKQVRVDLEAARAVRVEQLRAERGPLLEKLDVETLRALESGDKKKQAEVAAEKQRLRDITKDARLFAATQVEHLIDVKLSPGQADQ